MSLDSRRGGDSVEKSLGGCMFGIYLTFGLSLEPLCLAVLEGQAQGEIPPFRS